MCVWPHHTAQLTSVASDLGLPDLRGIGRAIANSSAVESQMKPALLIDALRCASLISTNNPPASLRITPFISSLTPFISSLTPFSVFAHSFQCLLRTLLLSISSLTPFISSLTPFNLFAHSLSTLCSLRGLVTSPFSLARSAFDFTARSSGRAACGSEHSCQRSGVQVRQMAIARFQ